MDISSVNNIINNNASADNKIKQNLSLAKPEIYNINIDKSMIDAKALVGIDILDSEIFSDILKLAGFVATPNNLKLVQALIMAEIPVSEENMALLNQSTKLMDNDMQKAIFLLKNDLQISTENSQMVKGYINKEIQLMSQISDFAETIANIEDIELRDKLLNIIFEDTDATIDEKTMFKEKITKNISEDIALPISKKPEGSLTQKTSFEPEYVADEKLTPDKTPTNFSEKYVESKTNLTQQYGKEIISKEALELNETDINNIAKQKQQIENLEIDNAGEGNVLSLEQEDFKDEEKMEDVFAKEAKMSVGEKSVKSEFKKPREIENIKQNILSKFAMKMDNIEPKAIDKMLNELKQALKIIKQELPIDTPVAHKLMESVQTINKNIDFLNEIKNSVYVQIPVNINDKQVNAELFVFNNSKNKKLDKSKKESQSALLSLELLSLGRLETYIQKIGENINCQFRVEDESVSEAIKSNIGFLNERLQALNMNLINCSYKKMQEPFNLTDSEPVFDENDADNGKEIFYTFDIRT